MGSCFAPAQGGLLSPWAAAIVDELRNLGFVGVGQSSWGPTLYGFSEEPRRGLATAEQLRGRLGLPRSAAVITTAANDGASLEHGLSVIHGRNQLSSDSRSSSRSIRTALVDRSLMAYGMINLRLCTIAPHE